MSLSVDDFKYHLQVDFCKSRFPLRFLISVRFPVSTISERRSAALTDSFTTLLYCKSYFCRLRSLRTGEINA